MSDVLGMSPEAFAAFYARHEAAVLRFFMQRVRAPALACDLTAETFAAALAQSFDPSRQSEASWVLELANAQLLRAHRVGAVDDGARERLSLAPVALDDRTLDRVWQLRGPDRSDERKPRRSEHVVVREDARRVVAADDPWASRAGGALVALDGHADGAFARAGTASVEFLAYSPAKSTLASGVMLPAVADALVAAAARRHDGRMRRRRLAIAARVALALVTVTWVAGEAVLPDRPAATSGTVWLPYEAERVSGQFPRSWYFATTRQAPRVGREVVTFTTFATGNGSDSRCGALSTLGTTDAAVSIVDGRPRPVAAGCARRARVARRPVGDGLWALIVLGRHAPGTVEREADEIASRAKGPA